MTSAGCRCAYTVIAPSGAWASVPTKVPTASHRAQRGRPRVAQAPTASASVRTIVTPPTDRFPNSI